MLCKVLGFLMRQSPTGQCEGEGPRIRTDLGAAGRDLWGCVRSALSVAAETAAST